MSNIQSSNKGSFLPINRVEALTDGVFAIAMTLLVLELSVPVITGSSVNTELLGKLLELWPKLLVYILSFVLLGMMWVHHRLMFHYIERSDGKLAWMNILFLMFVALIPFAASLLGEYSNSQIAVLVYGIVALLIIIMSLVIWIYITKIDELADRVIEPEIAIRRKIFYLIGCFFFILGIGISFISPTTSLCIYVLTALLTIIISWKDSHGFLSLLFVRILEKRRRS